MEYSLHTYLNPLRQEGAPPAYIEAVHRNAQPLADRGLPIILSLAHLAHLTGAPHKVLLRIVDRRIDPYRIFTIRKHGGGKRFICVPEPTLMRVQRFIHRRILCAKHVLNGVSGNVTAYRPGSSHIVNANRHVGAEWLVKLDVTRFFESISERQVYHVFRGLGYRALVAFGLTRLCTRVLPFNVDRRRRDRNARWMPGDPPKFLGARIVGHLPQGAPTSPMLANLVCALLDSSLKSMANEASLTFTRYADDMTFSGHMPDREAAVRFAAGVAQVVSRYGFSINLQKTRIAKNGGPKIVTGLSVDGETVRLPRAYKDKLRQEIHFLKKFGLHEHCSRIQQKNHLSYLLHLAGKIEYARKIEPALGKRLTEQFEGLFPEFLQIKQFI